jgi:UDP-N-acetylmuramoyl-L-alanyl-D-glutamate--2,6-diaminopimelate ligase
MLKSVIRKVVPEQLLAAYHYLLAKAAAFLYGHPSEKIVVIGVTGTNGKSTTAQFIGRMLECAGHCVGWTTTAGFKIADHEWPNDKKMTMLGRLQTQKLLREMVDAGCEYAIIETSSQGVAQFRHVGINYDLAVFTNLTPEHIEAHGGFENYKRAKGKLFASLSRLRKKEIGGREIEKTIVVNLSDPHADYFLSFNAEKYCGFAIGSVGEFATRLNTSPTVATNVAYESGCTMFNLGDLTVHFEPIGRFYLENALAAATVVKALGVGNEELRGYIESLRGVPGRLEKINEGQPFEVIVDYAYEPFALSAAYEAVGLLPRKRVIQVLGSAGGGRDVARRKILGQMAARKADIVIVTNEDPYDENPLAIIDEVANAAKAEGKEEGISLFRVLDRGEAIGKAITLANDGDLVLITGKGCEPVMAVADGKKIPWDDRVAARSAIRKKYGRA